MSGAVKRKKRRMKNGICAVMGRTTKFKALITKLLQHSSMGGVIIHVFHFVFIYVM